MTAESPKPARHIEPAVTLADLAGGDYVDMEGAAKILGLTPAELKRFRSEKINGGRTIQRKTKKGEDYVANVPVSPRAALIPEPKGELRRTIVWDRSVLLAVAEEMAALSGKKSK